MSRTASFHEVIRAVRVAESLERRRLPTAEGLGILSEVRLRHWNRRAVLRGIAGGAAAGALGPIAAFAAPKPRTSVDVAIVGGGLAGLACAYELQKQGVASQIYEAGARVGGRCWSLRSFFPGQVAERGGEFIDTPHKAMQAYMQEFGLAKEDVGKAPGAVAYYFNGRHYAESAVVDEFRALVGAMRRDLRTLGNPTADSFSASDAALDYTSLREYLQSRGAGPLAAAVIEQAYKAEYGLEIDEQSCLAFLLFIHADRRSKFTPFGSSDERFHVLGGNDQVAHGLADRLMHPVTLGRKLVALRKSAAGRVVLTLDTGAGTIERTHDAVVLALPFSTLRDVALHPSLGLPSWKTYAIQQLRYGTNAKMMLGFGSKPWAAQGSNGASYSDLPHHQNTWETNPARAAATHAVLTDYSSGTRGAALDPSHTQSEAELFLGDLDVVYPGAASAASRDAAHHLRAHLEHWPSNPLTKGSYTANHPGYFTTIADNEAKPVGNVYFAGEHASSFYEWQGYMEGGALSGQHAAAAILQDLKVGAYA